MVLARLAYPVSYNIVVLSTSHLYAEKITSSLTKKRWHEGLRQLDEGVLK